jgi:hypothetical protein
VKTPASGVFRAMRSFNCRVWTGGALVSNIGTWMQGRFSLDTQERIYPLAAPSFVWWPGDHAYHKGLFPPITASGRNVREIEHQVSRSQQSGIIPLASRVWVV